MNRTIAAVSVCSDVAPNIPDSLQEPFRSALSAASNAWLALMRDKLVCLVLFGSVARRQAADSSDIDLLIVAEGFPRSLRDRRRPLLDAWERTQAAKGLPHVEWSLVTKSPDEARFHSPLYLDIVEDGILILDRDRFFEQILSEMRERMRTLGSRRVYLQDGSWYWDLKPDYRRGEIFRL